MALLIIFGIAGLLLGLSLATRSVVETVFTVALLTLLCLMLGFLVSLAFEAVLPTEYAHQKDITLASVRYQEGTRVFLGLNAEETEYVYWMERKEGRIKMDSIPISSSTVQREKREDGLIKVYSEEFERNWYRWLGLHSWGNKYKIFIPKTSKTQELEVKLD